MSELKFWNYIPFLLFNVHSRVCGSKKGKKKGKNGNNNNNKNRITRSRKLVVHVFVPDFSLGSYAIKKELR